MTLSIRCVHSLNINTLPQFFYLLSPHIDEQISSPYRHQYVAFGANWENLINYPGSNLCLDSKTYKLVSVLH